MVHERVYINALELCSSAGRNLSQSFHGLLESQYNLNDEQGFPGFKIHPDVDKEITTHCNQKDFSGTDRSTQLLLNISKQVNSAALAQIDKKTAGVVIASSRGTSLKFITWNLQTTRHTTALPISTKFTNL